MSRATPYLSKPTADWNELFEKLSNSTFFLLSRNGPTVFRVKDEEDRVFKVTLGSPHSCTCANSQTQSVPSDTSSTNSGDLSASASSSSAPNSSASSRNVHQFCVHKLYCILKVLRISKDHPLGFQSSYTDSELDQVLAGKCSSTSRTREREAAQRREHVLAIRAARQQRLNPSTAKTTDLALAKEANNFVPRQPLQEPLPNEDASDLNICPICQDCMTPEQPLSWCRRGCGNNVHASCMQHYSNHKTNQHQETTCPLCRESWDLVLLKLDATSSSTSAAASSSSSTVAGKQPPLLKVKCQNCSCFPRRLFYRCVECSQKKYGTFVDYCSDCYPRVGEFHSDHHFITSDVSITNPADIVWLPCRNPRGNSLAHSRNSSGSLGGLEDDANSSLQTFLSLQQREITTEDYNLLLLLDEHNQRSASQNPYQVSSTDLISHLLLALPSVSPYEISKNPLKYSQCWCQTSENTSSPSSGLGSLSPRTAHVGESFYSLPCSHLVHRRCLRSELDLLLYEDYNKLLLGYSCHHPHCNKKIFFCLKRTKSVKKRTPKTEESSASTSIPGQLLATNHHLLPLTAGMRISSLTSSVGLGQGTGALASNSDDFIGIVGDTLLAGMPSPSPQPGRNFLPNLSGQKKPQLNRKSTKGREVRSSVSSPASLTSLDGLLSSSGINGGTSGQPTGPSQPPAVVQPQPPQSGFSGGMQNQLQSQYISLIQDQSSSSLNFANQLEEMESTPSVSAGSGSESSRTKRRTQKLLPLGRLRSNANTQSFSTSSGSLVVVSTQASTLVPSSPSHSFSASGTTSAPATSSFFKLPSSSTKVSEPVSGLNPPVLEILSSHGSNLIQSSREKTQLPPTRPRNRYVKDFRPREAEDRGGPLTLSIQSYSTNV